MYVRIVIIDVILCCIILHCLLFFDVTCSMSSWMLPMYGPNECNKNYNHNNQNNHNYDTSQRKNLYLTYCRTKVCKISVKNIGKRLYNKLPNNLKSIDNILHFRRKLKLFLLQQTFYSIEYFMYKK
jgi:hypothetical protein